MLAAIALEHGLTVMTADIDFERFGGLRWENPLRRVVGPRASRRRGTMTEHLPPVGQGAPAEQYLTVMTAEFRRAAFRGQVGPP